MKATVIIAAMLALGFTAARAALELVPEEKEDSAEKITFRQLIFKGGQRTISYEPPRLWTYHASGHLLQMTPPKAQRAEAAIEAAPGAPGVGGIETARERFLRTVPPAAQGVTILAEEASPFLVNNHATLQITASYQVLGQTFVRSMLSVDADGTRLTFRLTAQKADFDALQLPSVPVFCRGTRSKMRRERTPDLLRARTSRNRAS